MEVMTVHLGAKGQIVVPKAVREQLGLKEGDVLMLMVEGQRVVLRARPVSFTDAMLGLHKEVWKDSEGWLDRERDSWE